MDNLVNLATSRLRAGREHWTDRSMINQGEPAN